MFDVTGDRATARGLKVVMFAMLFIVGIKFAQMFLDWIENDDFVPVAFGWSLATWAKELMLNPLLMLASLVTVAGCWLGFKGSRYAWARQFAIAAMAVFTVVAILRFFALTLVFVSSEYLYSLGFGSKATGLLIAGTGVYLYYLLALDAGDDFPGGLDRGPRILFIPLAPIVVGAFIAYRGDYFPYDLGAWAVIAAAGLTAFSIYNRLPDTEPPAETPPSPGA